MFSFLRNIKIRKDNKSNKRYFCIAHDAIFVDEFISEKRRDSIVKNKDNQQQFIQQFEEDSSWFI